eukprot:jgi/Bigna1/77132/fgenesh1_pg.46_\
MSRSKPPRPKTATHFARIAILASLVLSLAISLVWVGDEAGKMQGRGQVFRDANSLRTKGLASQPSFLPSPSKTKASVLRMRSSSLTPHQQMWEAKRYGRFARSTTRVAGGIDQLQKVENVGVGCQALKTHRWRRLQSRRFLVDVRQDLIIAEFALKLAAGSVGVRNGAPFPNVPLPNYKMLYRNLSVIQQVVGDKRRQLESVLGAEELDGFCDRVNIALEGLKQIADESGNHPPTVDASSSTAGETTTVTAAGEQVSSSSSTPSQQSSSWNSAAGKVAVAAEQQEQGVVAAAKAHEDAIAGVSSGAVKSGEMNRAENEDDAFEPDTTTAAAATTARWPPSRRHRTPPRRQQTMQKQDQRAAPADTSVVVPGSSERTNSSSVGSTSEGGEGMEEESGSFRVIMREDGTVDWDGVIEGGRDIAQFGADLWKPLNAKGEGGEGNPLGVDRDAILTKFNHSLRGKALRQALELLQMFGLLDVNVEAMVNCMGPNYLRKDALELSDPLDEDELAVLESQDRIGLTPTNLLNDLQVDLSNLTKFLKDTLYKLRMAIDFYGLGTKLLGNDIQYSAWLIARAIKGDTLKPREARMLQRTAKDLFTLVPCTIILLIPLTPVGHVLVFSAIQKYFPDFYPSPYTERRQNLVRLYQEIEQKLGEPQE